MASVCVIFEVPTPLQVIDELLMPFGNKVTVVPETVPFKVVKLALLQLFPLESGLDQLLAQV